MGKIEQLVQDIFEERIDPSTLNNLELEQVFDFVQEMAENLVDDNEYRDGARLMLAVLAEIVDDRMGSTDMSCFNDAIEAAESRGCTYFEFECYTLQ
jgi:hypothetical protein